MQQQEASQVESKRDAAITEKERKVDANLGLSDRDNKLYAERYIGGSHSFGLSAESEIGLNHPQLVDAIRESIVAELRMQGALQTNNSRGMRSGRQVQSFSKPINAEFANAVVSSKPEIKDLSLLLKKHQIGDPLRPQKILLVGPSGAGKTTIAAALAKNCGMNCFMYKASMIADEWHNSCNTNLQHLFAQHMQAQQPCVIVIDEMQVLMQKHRNVQDYDASMLTTLWSLLDHYEDSNIFFVGTLNYDDAVPKQIVDRFQDDIIHVDLPDELQRQRIVEFAQSRFPKINFDKKISPAAIAKLTNGFSRRAIDKLVIKAAKIADLRSIKKFGPYVDDVPNPQVTFADYEQAIKDLKAAEKRFERPVSTKEKIFNAVKIVATHAAPPAAQAAVNVGTSIYAQQSAAKMNEKQLELTRQMHKENMQISKENIILTNKSLALAVESLKTQKDGQTTDFILKMNDLLNRE